MTVIILVVLASVAALYLSKPQRPWLAHAATLILLVAGGWQIHERKQSDARVKLVSEYIDREVGIAVAQYLDLLQKMTFYGSDGWLPANEEEFFSEKTAEILAHHVNIDERAPVLPSVTWRAEVHLRGTALRKMVSDLLLRNTEYLETEMVVALRKCVEMHVLSGAGSHVDRLHLLAAVAKPESPQPSSVWLPWPNGPEMLSSDLEVLQEIVGVLRKSKGKDWLALGYKHSRKQPDTTPGKHRVASPSLWKLHETK